jgi:hypothetical protein
MTDQKSIKIINWVTFLSMPILLIWSINALVPSAEIALTGENYCALFIVIACIREASNP